MHPTILPYTTTSALYSHHTPHHHAATDIFLPLQSRYTFYIPQTFIVPHNLNLHEFQTS